MISCSNMDENKDLRCSVESTNVKESRPLLDTETKGAFDFEERFVMSCSNMDENKDLRSSVESTNVQELRPLLHTETKGAFDFEERLSDFNG